MVVIIRVIQRSSAVIIKCQQLSTSATAFRQAVISTPTRVLAESISLRHCNYQLSAISSAFDFPNLNAESVTESAFPTVANRSLVVLFTWLAAQEKHIEKYRNLYFQRGFDVLTVKTSPFDLLLPNSGARRIAQNCVHALQRELSAYPSVVLHAFSVGAYQFGEMLIEMQKLAEENKRKSHIEKRIKGIIFDSAVPIEELSNGVSRSITGNHFLYKCIKSMIDTHLKISTSFATKYYSAASKAVWGNYMRVPALVLVSQNDKIGTASANGRLTRVWRDFGIDVTYKCWEKSEHVQHLPKHTKEYEQLIDQFIDKIKINNRSAEF